MKIAATIAVLAVAYATPSFSQNCTQFGQHKLQQRPIGASVRQHHDFQ
jgi:hypothetical protein